MQLTCVTHYWKLERWLKLILKVYRTYLDAFGFLFFPADLILAEGNSSSLSINQGTTFITGPYLDGNGISNVTTQISTHAYLPCKVSQAILWKFLQRQLLLLTFNATFYVPPSH